MAIHLNILLLLSGAGIHKKKALDALEKSVKMGYGTKQFFMSDADLDSIKNEKRFNEILEKMR